ncbi:hypothetical protein KY313_00625 [Candidatus Woesearchaeota archaeon]|jgi:rRNA-processing protein FCF1|nr:hypothetical protein [Candidatus Woesearchaeota archaeon]
MQKILLDTNFLLIPAAFNVDIFSELNRLFPRNKLFILDLSIGELKNIELKQKGKHKQEARLGLQMIKKYKISTIKTEKHINASKSTSTIHVDNLIVDFALTGGYLVATQDKEIKVKLKKQNKKSITLRQKKYLIIT